MKYLQIVATVACAVLILIAWQLHGMRPLRYSEIERMMKMQPEAAYEKLRDAPIVTIGEAHRGIDVQGVVRIDGDVSIGNQVSVKTGHVDESGKYEEEPLKVEVVR